MRAMKDKILWALIAALLVMSLYNTYSIKSLDNSVQKSLKTLNQNVESLSRANASGTVNVSEKLPSRTRTMPVVAVSRDREGTIGSVEVEVLPGNNNVLINTNPFLGTNLQYSMNTAVAVAKQQAEEGFQSDYVFNFEAGNAQLVGGGSAGAASTIAVIAALKDAPLKDSAVITGTISPDGTIGRVGGVLQKAKAAGEAGYDHFLVPEGQSTIKYYERVVERDEGFGFDIFNTRYVPKTIDLKQKAQEEWNMSVVEVRNIEEAIPYFIEQNI